MPSINDLMKQAEGLGGSAPALAREAYQLGQASSQPDPIPDALSFGSVKEFARVTKGMNGGFKSLGEFAAGVRLQSQPNAFDDGFRQRTKSLMHRYESELLPKYKANSPTGMNESFSGADGGALVPPEFVAQLLMRMYSNDILQRCTLFPIGSNSIKIPAINETSRANGSRFGGVSSYWRREAGQLTATKPSLQTVDLSLESLSVMIRPTEELLSDTGGALDVFLNLIASQEIAFAIGDSLVNGDGVGKPKGIMNSAAKITVSAEAGQPAATINATNVLKMYSRLHRSCIDNAVWLYDQSIIPQLAQMTIGSAGANLVVYLPPGGLSNSPYGTLMGRPMVPVEFCQQLGTEGDLILVDMSQMLAATKGGIQAAVSMHLYFDTNELAYRYIIRVDGKCWWTSALTPKSGGPTQSCIVTLATR